MRVRREGGAVARAQLLEFHHANEPYALGGAATAENIALRCRAHNVYEAELLFGPYKPAVVRDAPVGYGRSGNYWSRDQ
jgi:hypothetical protein